MLERLLNTIERARTNGTPIVRINLHPSDLAMLESDLVGSGTATMSTTKESAERAGRKWLDGAAMSLAGVPVFTDPSVGQPQFVHSDFPESAGPPLTIGAARPRDSITVSLNTDAFHVESPRQRQEYAAKLLEQSLGEDAINAFNRTPAEVNHDPAAPAVHWCAEPFCVMPAEHDGPHRDPKPMPPQRPTPDLPQIICEHCLVRVEPLWTRREAATRSTLVHLRCHGVDRLVEIDYDARLPSTLTWDQIVDVTDLPGMEERLEARMLDAADLLAVVRAVLKCERGAG